MYPKLADFEVLRRGLHASTGRLSVSSIGFSGVPLIKQGDKSYGFLS